MLAQQGTSAPFDTQIQTHLTSPHISTPRVAVMSPRGGSSDQPRRGRSSHVRERQNLTAWAHCDSPLNLIGALPAVMRYIAMPNSSLFTASSCPALENGASGPSCTPAASMAIGGGQPFPRTGVVAGNRPIGSDRIDELVCITPLPRHSLPSEKGKSPCESRRLESTPQPTLAGHP